MSNWLRYFSFFGRNPRVDATEEVRFHLEMRIRDLIAQGMAPDEARRAAEAGFGNPDRVVDEVARIDTRIDRRAGRAEWWRDIARDARVGMRSLRRSLAFSVTAVVTAGLGIGATAAIVSAGYAILVRPLPFPQADRLVSIYAENPERGWQRVNISWPDYLSWREGNRAFADIGMWGWGSFTLAGEDSVAQRVNGAAVTSNLFRVLGVQPQLGRHFASDEDGVQRARVTLLSDGLWRGRFGADSGIVGKTILLDGRSYSVVGVMPPGFNFPDRGELWVPFQVDASVERGNRMYAGAIGRLKPDVTFEQAVADMRRIDAALAIEFPESNRDWRAQPVPMRADLVGDLQQPLKVFLWSVALVLLLVCANVANLMLARAAVRSRELALRSVLGASRARLGRQLITESMLVAGLGGAVGIAVAWWGVRLLRFAFPNQVPPYFISLGLDASALAILVAVTLVTGLLFGVLPAIRMSRVDLNTSIRDGDRAGAGARTSRLRSILVMAEVALSVVLMIGALLLMRSYRNLHSTDLGFAEQGVLSARVTLPSVTYSTYERSFEFYDRLAEQLRRIPGVMAVGHAQGIPFSGWNVASRVSQIEGMPVLPRNEQVDTHNQLVSPDFFKAMGVELVRGRWLTAQDRDTTALVALVNEQMVKVGFGGQDPIGRRMEVRGWPVATVVGVIRDYRHYQLPQPMGPATYFPWPAWPARGQTLVIRTSLDDPASVLPRVREAVRSIDPLVPLSDVQTFEEVVSRSLWRQRLQGNVLAIFALMSLVLACVGLYGVISYAVAQRTRELGVRMALGASRRSVLLMVFGQSGRVVAAGIGIGLIAAFFAVRIMAALLYGVEARDLTTFFTVPVVLAITALLATIAPALRATRVSPIVAIRSD